MAGGGCWGNFDYDLRVGVEYYNYPYYEHCHIGFSFASTGALMCIGLFMDNSAL